MKKLFTLTVFCSLFLLLLSGSVKSQNELYWTEGFEPGTSAALLTTAPAVGPAVPYYAAIGSGTWYIYGCYRTTGTACANGTYSIGGQPQSVPMGSNHLRLSKNIAPDSGFVVTPLVNFGIQELHFLRSNTGRRFDIYKTSDTGAVVNGPANTPTNWVLVTSTPNNTVACIDTLITIADISAKRLKINQGKNNLDYNIDSVFITSVLHIVPVVFNNLNLISTNGVVKLSWNIETQINTEHYAIERSADGRNFTQVGFLDATAASKYIFMDNAPLRGTSYYRIKGIDRDGSFKFSTAVRYMSGITRASVFAAPNPVKGGLLNLQITNVEKGTYSVNIYNAASQKVFTKSIVHDGGNSSLQPIVLPASVTPGIYTLQFGNALSKYNTNIVVQ